METPLIAKETPNPVNGGIASKGGAKEKQYQRAAALVDLAWDGIGIPKEVLDGDEFERAVKLHFLYNQFNWLWCLNLFALVLLNFLEKPLWCWKYGNSCEDRDSFFLGALPYLGKDEALIYEGTTFVLLVFQIFAPIAYEGWELYWKNSMNKLKIGLLLILACDMLVYATFSSPLLSFRLAPYIRVVFLILTSRHLRTCTVTLTGLLGQYISILALLLLFLLFASWLAYVIFEDTLEGKTIFTSYGTTLYQMFLLFTTANNPDVWIPAYRNSRWSLLFFGLYLLLSVYFITSLVLAVIYESYREQLATQIKQIDHMKKDILKKAFTAVDIEHLGYLTEDQCITLFEELNKYRSVPKISKGDFEAIFRTLDRNADFKINSEEFADFCNAIALKFQKEPSPSFLERYPAFYNSDQCKKLKDFVRSPYFENGVASILILYLIVAVIETTLDRNSSGQKFVQKIQFFFGRSLVLSSCFPFLLLLVSLYKVLYSSELAMLPWHFWARFWVYVVEIALKIFSLGFDAYWMKGQNKFDFIITGTICIGETLTFFFPSRLRFFSSREWIRYLLIGQMLMLVKLLLLVRKFRVFVATFLNLIPNLMPYLGMLFCALCFYCSLGLQLFGGIVNLGNPNLQYTDLYINNYVLFNFNDYPNGMVTLFNLLVMGGNWPTLMQSYADLTGTNWTLVYFISFYLVAVLLLLNVVVAFVLEAFNAEMNITKKENQPNGVKPIPRSRSTADTLVRQILKDVLDKTSERSFCQCGAYI